ncbi:succinate dehydrogenase, hydrophobic membrane anchor protein [Acidihalobacter prosperus]|uniref:Succinate dehydrogenase hydrophobic membrane anchor subunit n=1 Tax=Acidihalobacter prosperus TaxID=160660 RepID=A0A1A6C840_9GAMM|nr:succinate dehydrogenase, hydrophobic membrane anchor protein [Acidihalobacter prosperus]OBS10721.1 succinate dehydrogenase, hydrophobic membrane anchor protein [Acidihalobacter prosperus]
MKTGLSGLRAWLIQRVSAVYLGGFFIFALVALAIHPHLDAARWQTWLSQPLLQLALALFMIMLLAHAWVGARDVIVDYVRPIGLRLGLLAVVALFLLGCGLWAARILLLASGS